MLGCAPGDDMHVEVVAEARGGGHRILFVIGGELYECLICFAVDYGAVFYPADFVFFGPYFEEAAVVIEDLEGLAVDYRGHACRDGGYPVMEVHLAGGDVDGVVLLMVETLASRRKPKKTKDDEQGQCLQLGHRSSEAPGKMSDENWSLREHSLWRSS